VRLPEENEADAEIQTLVQPDTWVICDSSKLDEAGCRRAPDFLIEVLSPATSSKDLTLKKDLYERHGVREYWLVHPTDRVLTRHFLDDGRYTPALIEAMPGTTAVRTLPGLAIDWNFAEPEFEPPRHTSIEDTRGPRLMSDAPPPNAPSLRPVDRLA
jgi:Uma2 family endonuclease